MNANEIISNELNFPHKMHEATIRPNGQRTAFIEVEYADDALWFALTVNGSITCEDALWNEDGSVAARDVFLSWKS
jgi:hypothetical protein